jgi:hypothetical protein
MRHLRLRSGLSFGCVDGELVFLDLDQDRYFTLGGEAGALFRRLAGLAQPPADKAAFDRLLGLGLLEAAEVGRVPSPAPGHIPRTSLLEEASRARPGLLMLAETAVQLLPIKVAIARRRVAGRLARIVAFKARLSAPADAEPLARRFIAARPFLPIAPNCLADSLALAEFLLRRGASADLVFGVKLIPFAAHAWVQTKDLILNDHVDHVREFTPVLVA